jgi:hypothetical protein
MQERFVEAVGPRAWLALSSALKQVVSVAEVLESGVGARRRPARPRLSARA